MTTLTIAAIQHKYLSTPKKTMNYLQNAINKSVSQGAKLIVLQELHNTAYFCQHENVEAFDLAETIPGPSTVFFSKLAKKHQCVIVGSVFEKRAAGIYHNTAVIFDCDGSIAGKYRKMHIPDDPGFYEKFYFTPGDATADGLNGFKPIQTQIGKIGLLICWDQWFPEAARLMALAGAEILVYPTAIGWDNNDTPDEQSRQLDAWITIQRAHAIANNLPLVSCNRTGFEAEHQPSDSSSENPPENKEDTNGIQFWGNSFICGQQGEILANAEAHSEELLIADVDLNHTETVRRIWPFLRDRRIDAYHNLNQRFIDTPPKKGAS
ncbi:MAG: N-carbamoylputrescine amidase [Oleiphilaceae bacterium]|jgi:N-carbamoylputrescine amidase